MWHFHHLPHKRSLNKYFFKWNRISQDLYHLSQRNDTRNLNLILIRVKEQWMNLDFKCLSKGLTLKSKLESVKFLYHWGNVQETPKTLQCLLIHNISKQIHLSLKTFIASYAIRQLILTLCKNLKNKRVTKISWTECVKNCQSRHSFKFCKRHLSIWKLSGAKLKE